MNERLKSESMDMLFECVLKLETLEECYAFFDDVCTIHELRAFAQRVSIAAMLNEGKTYSEIGEATGASTATISRINRSLVYGSDGYKIVFDRLKGE